MKTHDTFNSFLLAASLAVTGWVAKKTADNGERIAGMQAAVEAAKESSVKAERASAEGLARLEHKMEEMLPRREYDARVLAFETEQRKTDIRLREIDLELLKLKQKL